MTLPTPSYFPPYMGCDPEFFFTLNGETIGAEKVIPTEGLRKDIYATSKFVIDGVQAELNPAPNNCRANLANEISACFRTLESTIKKQNKEIKVDFSRTIEISKENLLELNENSRKFGCAPSKSIYRKSGLKIDTVDPTEYRTRAAGGHIHIGHMQQSSLKAALTKHDKRTVQLLDILVGNTCVLVDRDVSNVERRKLYGKAGEFRSPAHGLEYRTLSNFWLTAYPLMSLAFGLVRLAVVLAADNKVTEFHDAFTSAVKAKDIKAAINNNDFDLAMFNFKAIEALLQQVTAGMNAEHYPINGTNIKEFYHFISKVSSDGLGYWFKQDPLTHWTTLPEAHAGGFNDFLRRQVSTDMQAVVVTPTVPATV